MRRERLSQPIAEVTVPSPPWLVEVACTKRELHHLTTEVRVAVEVEPLIGHDLDEVLGGVTVEVAPAGSSNSKPSAVAAGGGHEDPAALQDVQPRPAEAREISASVTGNVNTLAATDSIARPSPGRASSRS